jgi:hypothetical protein
LALNGDTHGGPPLESSWTEEYTLHKTTVNQQCLVCIRWNVTDKACRYMVVSIVEEDTILNIIWRQIAEHVIILTNLHVNNTAISVNIHKKVTYLIKKAEVHQTVIRRKWSTHDNASQSIFSERQQEKVSWHFIKFGTDKLQDWLEATSIETKSWLLITPGIAIDATSLCFTLGHLVQYHHSRTVSRFLGSKKLHASFDAVWSGTHLIKNIAWTGGSHLREHGGIECTVYCKAVLTSIICLIAHEVQEKVIAYN